MPIRSVPGNADIGYFLVSHDADGHERTGDPEAPDGLLSKVVINAVRTKPITDIFIISHGWKGDLAAAVDQYDRWMSAMAGCSEDVEALKLNRPGFQALLVGLHWPSLPWGDELLDRTAVAFSVGEDDAFPRLIDEYAERIADTPPTREALSIIFEAAIENIAPTQLPPEVRNAYRILDRESRLASAGEGAAPGEDREPFDPETSYQNAVSDPADLGRLSLDGVLAPLRQLSFWKMKDRARLFGEIGGHRLLRTMQQAAGESGRDVRFHLMGHSFGCIVVSAILRGPDGSVPLPRAIDTLFLVQGAMSLWSFCESITSRPSLPGYFRSIIADQKVSGPIVVTLSEHDRAVRKYYPLGAGARQQIAYALGEFPKYGGIGTFGVRGPGLDIEDLQMLDAQGSYHFRPGKIYNITADNYISKLEGASGAHNDIAHKEVAHAFWESLMV
jgi:hypothetical protein